MKQTRNKFPKNLGAFRVSVDAASKFNDHIPIDNNNEEHAEYALAKIFQYAKGKLYIFADSLNKNNNGLRSELYLKNFYQFLERSKENSVSVILRNDNTNSETLTFLKAIKFSGNFKEYENRVDLRLLNDGVEVEHTKEGKEFHFTTSPNSGSYRLEYDIKNKKAILDFNNPEYSSKLVKLFNKYKEQSSLLDNLDIKMPKNISEIIHVSKSKSLIPSLL
jgi:hypothetical protein